MGKTIPPQQQRTQKPAPAKTTSRFARTTGRTFQRPHRYRAKAAAAAPPPMPPPPPHRHHHDQQDNDSVPASHLGSTAHDRHRRQQRDIPKMDLIRARRLGMHEPARYGRVKITYARSVLIYDPRHDRAITSYRTVDPRAPTTATGSCYVEPILLQHSREHQAPHVMRLHQQVTRQLQAVQHQWKSHSVLVIDNSGSMRWDDVNGGRSRSDALWLVLARDFVAAQITAHSSSLLDVVSVVLMSNVAHVAIGHEPLDWVLYNKLLDWREWQNLKPQGPGHYLPALAKAEELLGGNIKHGGGGGGGACALSLLFVSDGRPSDRHADRVQLVPRMEQLASQLGRRLTVCCIGMAGPHAEFTILQQMADAASQYTPRSTFVRMQPTVQDLARHLRSSLTTSLSQSRSELTDVSATGGGGASSRQVRQDVRRERRNAPDDVAVTADWRMYGSNMRLETEAAAAAAVAAAGGGGGGGASATTPTAALPSLAGHVKTSYVWNDQHGEFCPILDPRCRACQVMVMDATTGAAMPHMGTLCGRCSACFLCHDCLGNTGTMRTHHGLDECQDMVWRRRRGHIVTTRQPLPSFNVAMKTSAFGEGAERLAFKFRFLDERGRFIGPKMVAKQSRFVENEYEPRSKQLQHRRRTYHEQFVRTQATAAQFAGRFNAVLDQDLPQQYRSGAEQEALRVMPRIRFVEPIVFDLVNVNRNNNSTSVQQVLVEPMIEGHYIKFNNNFGHILNQEVKFAIADKDEISALLLGHGPSSSAAGGPSGPQNSLNPIAEEGEEDDDEMEEGDKSGDDENADTNHPGRRGPVSVSATSSNLDRLPTTIPDTDFVQAFSHFTFVHSKEHLMVVDLQGALQIDTDGSRQFLLTDPAIHHDRRQQRPQSWMPSQKYGRTDRGKKGMQAFFESHVCNDACRLLGLPPPTNKQRGGGKKTSASTRRVVVDMSGLLIGGAGVR